jgi:superfamily II DNA or RNA helicase
VPIEISDKLASKKMFTQEDEDSVFDSGAYLPRLFAEAASRCHDKKALFFWPNCDSSKEADKYFRLNGIESRHVDGYMNDNEIDEILKWHKQPGYKALHNCDLLYFGHDDKAIDCIGVMRLLRSLSKLKQILGRGTRPNCDVDSHEDAETRKMAISESEKPSCKVLDLMIQLGDVKNKFAESTCLITEDEKEREFIRDEMRKAGRPISMAEIESKLKAKRTTDKERQLAPLAEDAANSALKRGKKEPYFWDIINRNFGPSDNASPAQMGYLKSLGYKGPLDINKIQASRIIARFKPKQTA